MFLFLQLIVVITLLGNVRTEGPVTIIRNLLQNNLVGAPVIHKITTWNFDPEVSLKRREQFQEVCIFDGSFELIYQFSRGLNFFWKFSVGAWFPWWKADWKNWPWDRWKGKRTITRATCQRRGTAWRNDSPHQNWIEYCGIVPLFVCCVYVKCNN